MARIINLVGGRLSAVALETDDSQIWEIPFFSEKQAFDFIEVPEEHQRDFPRATFSIRPISGGPRGYLFFALMHGDDVLGIIVWGPHGVLPTLFLNWAEAVAAAHADADHRVETRPSVSPLGP